MMKHARCLITYLFVLISPRNWMWIIVRHHCTFYFKNIYVYIKEETISFAMYEWRFTVSMSYDEISGEEVDNWQFKNWRTLDSGCSRWCPYTNWLVAPAAIPAEPSPHSALQNPPLKLLYHFILWVLCRGCRRGWLVSSFARSFVRSKYPWVGYKLC